MNRASGPELGVDALFVPASCKDGADTYLPELRGGVLCYGAETGPVLLGNPEFGPKSLGVKKKPMWLFGQPGVFYCTWYKDDSNPLQSVEWRQVGGVYVGRRGDLK